MFAAQSIGIMCPSLRRSPQPVQEKRMSDLPTQIGKYRIIRELGRGATATVYLAQSPTYPEPVALKHVRFDDKAGTTWRGMISSCCSPSPWVARHSSTQTSCWLFSKNCMRKR